MRLLINRMLIDRVLIDRVLIYRRLTDPGLTNYFSHNQEFEFSWFTDRRCLFTKASVTKVSPVRCSFAHGSLLLDLTQSYIQRANQQKC